MPRILIAECIHEICSFNPVPTRYDDFAIQRGNDLFDYHRPLGSEVGGALKVFDADPNVSVVPTFGARGITSGGTIAQSDFERLASELLEAVRQAKPVDGAYFALHGAMASTNQEDPEGFFLQEARKFLGDTIPIVASFDLHGILTDRILEHADAIVLYHTYPHVDFFETGQRAARLLLRLLRKEVRPVTARVAIPALVRGDELITATGVFGKIVGQARQIEQSQGGLSAGMFIGNPFTDVPELCCNSVVVTDGDRERAEREALRLAGEFWEHRHKMQARLTSLEESVRLAKATPGTIILMDPADATSSGASGDSNVILRELLRAGYQGRALLPIVDAAAVQIAVQAGIGARIRTRVGGTLDAKRFVPLEIEGVVRMISDGRFRSESFGQTWFAGTAVVLDVKNVSLVVTSRPVHLYDRSLFLAHGLDPRHFDLVVVKSPHCQPHMYADWCTRLINVDAPGSTSANLPTLGHTRCRRPIFPLDGEVAFTPRARVFSRHS
ncbi:MAG TPA: M81 family metallopeptidase [Gemmataceae bacterium]|nr:M81 family metallopeptidase [Gemmataceae bacterium]